MMNTTVIVPTYQRPDDLYRCLESLKRQKLPAYEVIVVVRDDDAGTWSMLHQFVAENLNLKFQRVMIPGQIAAMNAGLEMVTGDIIAFTDDDASPHIDWIQKITTYFESDSKVGGVGGRDVIQNSQSELRASKKKVGQLSWYGRIVGNHHRGLGNPREVDILKGVNMSFRSVAVENLCFDSRMLGSGAQVHNEIAFCLSLKRNGWKIIYDPSIQVDHYAAQRFDEDQRNQFNSLAYLNAVHNETVALLDHLSPLQRFVFSLWSIFVGSSQAFGLLQWVRFFPTFGSLATQRLLASWQGRRCGWATWRSSSKVFPRYHARDSQSA
ncbi:MAG: glycosyltransferase family 2 protein [Cyanobacteria bacterium J06560_5]